MKILAITMNMVILPCENARTRPKSMNIMVFTCVMLGLYHEKRCVHHENGGVSLKS